jgi:hypothetical protein
MFNLNSLSSIAMARPRGPEACYQDLGRNISAGMLDVVGQTLARTTGPESWNREDSRTFWQLHLDPKEIAGADPLLAAMIGRFDVPDVSLLYTQPWTAIRPHVDRDRLCGINVLLTASPSTSYWLTGERRNDQDHIIEVDLTRFRYYAFNTSITHGIVNRAVPRLVMSINFARPTSYSDVVTWFHTNPV